ncbi:MAG: hypothetical protein GY859_01480 [Desulfobacterales bacterium]|nr:hypothetical protein [Desulfobacterales bacterium]
MRKVLAFVIVLVTLAVVAHYYQIINISFLSDIGLESRDAYVNKTSDALEETEGE